MTINRHMTRLKVELDTLDAVLWAFMELDNDADIDEITRLATECVRAKDRAIACARIVVRYHDMTLTPSDPVRPRLTGSTVTTVTPSPTPPMGGVDGTGSVRRPDGVTPSDGVTDV